MTESQAEQHYGVEIDSRRQLNELQRLEKTHGGKVHDWLDEGMSRKTMGSPSEMRAFRKPESTAETGESSSPESQPDLNLEIDPDPQLEREAEATAQRVMQGGNLGVQRLGTTDVHIQRSVGPTPPPFQPDISAELHQAMQQYINEMQTRRHEQEQAEQRRREQIPLQERLEELQIRQQQFQPRPSRFRS